jgi:hypothetical protein
MHTRKSVPSDTKQSMTSSVALDKRMWRIEAMSMVGTLGVVALVVAIVMK